MPDSNLALYAAGGLVAAEVTGVTNFTNGLGGGGPPGEGWEPSPEIQLPEINIPDFANAPDWGAIADAIGGGGMTIVERATGDSQAGGVWAAMQGAFQTTQQVSDLRGDIEDWTTTLTERVSGMGGGGGGDDSPTTDPDSTPTDSGGESPGLGERLNNWLYSGAESLGQTPGSVATGVLDGLKSGFEASWNWGEETGESINEAIWGQPEDPLTHGFDSDDDSEPKTTSSSSSRESSSGGGFFGGISDAVGSMFGGSSARESRGVFNSAPKDEEEDLYRSGGSPVVTGSQNTVGFTR